MPPLICKGFRVAAPEDGRTPGLGQHAGEESLKFLRWPPAPFAGSQRLIEVCLAFIQQPLEFGRHYDFTTPAACLVFAQGLAHDFIRAFISTGLHQFGNVIFEVSRQGDIHGFNLTRCEKVSTVKHRDAEAFHERGFPN